MSLTDELAKTRANAVKHLPPEKYAVMQANVLALRNSGIEKTMLKVGDQAPAIKLPNAKGELVDVASLLKSGPVIINFYRGGWCPYCNLELRAFQRLLPDITTAGASLIAISPEVPDKSLGTTETTELTFEVLSDVDQKVGRAFGLVFELSDELQAIYKGFGLDLPDFNGTPDKWELPVPGTYVIGSDGKIIYANADVDYQTRADPQEVLNALKATLKAA